MFYCLDFDGTIIPSIHYTNANKFFIDTLEAKTLLSESEIKFYDTNYTFILTDRPEDGLLVVKAYCKKIGLNRVKVYSSYGDSWIKESTRKKIVLKKVALMLMLTNDTEYTFKTKKNMGQYIDKDISLMRDINNLYYKLMKMKIEPFKLEKK